MALLTCPSCGQQISSFAAFCPYCGYTREKTPIKRRSTTYDEQTPAELTFVSAVAGTVCFALSLYLISANPTIDAISILPYCLLLAIIAVAVNWAGACTSIRILSIVCAAFYLAAAVVMLFYAPIWALPFALPIGLSIWTYVSALRKDV